MPETSNDKDAAAPQASLLQTITGLCRELPGLISDRVDLLALEMRRAGSALMQIAALVVMASLLAVTAWLALWGALVGLLVSLGLHWALALLLVLLVNLGAAWWAISRVRSLAPSLRLPATRRHLTLSPSPQPKAPPAAPQTQPERRPDPIPPYASNASNASNAAAP